MNKITKSIRMTNGYNNIDNDDDDAALQQNTTESNSFGEC